MTEWIGAAVRFGIGLGFLGLFLGPAVISIARSIGWHATASIFWRSSEC